MIIVDSFGMRDSGRVREVNEDYFRIVEPEEATEAEARGRLFVVADGMGNQGAGEEAAKIAVNTVVEVYYSGEGGDDPGESLRYSVERAHVAVREAAEQNPELHKMGVTLTALAIVEDRAYIAHVGDTRAYIVRKGHIAQLSDDHNWAGEQLRKGAITRVHANTHPRRKNLTRVLGQTPNVEIDTKSDSVEPGDIFLLASDGLYDTLSDAEIERVLLDTNPEMACRELVARANRNGGADNIAAIIVKTTYEGKPFLSKEHKPKFSLNDIKLPFDISKLGKLPKIPTGFPIYMGAAALALLVIITCMILLFRSCGNDNEKPVEPPKTVDNRNPIIADRTKVKIITVPEGANIKVNGAPIGLSPRDVELEPGEHQIDIEHEGYQTKNHKLVVHPGEVQIPLNFILVPNQAERSPDLAFVPAGFFLMGRTAASVEEGPQKKVYLDAFYIDKKEVGNAEYKTFIEATAKSAPAFWNDATRNAPDLPVVGVDWNDADAYCKWAGKRLPYESEWEKAARGEEGWYYPWGNVFDASKANIDGDADTFLDVAPVDKCAEGKSPYGVLNMVGNVAEWTASYFEPNYYTTMPMKNPRGPDMGTRRVIRGGSYRTSSTYATTTYRSAFSPDSKKPFIGFRCAKD